jgi:hypothetical protein
MYLRNGRSISDSWSPAGEIRIDAPAGWSVKPARIETGGLAPDEKRLFEFSVTAPSAAAPGRYTLTDRSTFGAMTYSATSDSIRVGLRNVAQGKAATQKSLDWGGTPDRAVDGNIDGTFFNGSVTHTAEDGSPEPWWQVDLGADTQIQEIAIWTARTAAPTGRPSTFTVNGSGRYVRVQLKGNAPLSLAEVEVLAVGDG